MLKKEIEDLKLSADRQEKLMSDIVEKMKILETIQK